VEILEKTSPACMSTTHSYSGWLILIGIGIALMIIVCLAGIPGMIQNFTGDTWANIKSPLSESYHPLWAGTLIMETAFQISYTIALIALGYLYLKRKKSFPNWFVWLTITGLAYLATDLLIVEYINSTLPEPLGSTLDSYNRGLLYLVIAIVVSAIAVPYIITSKRVKETFTED